MVHSFVLQGHDPWKNLAQEEALFDGLASGDLALVQYVNAPCVVVGKHQNPLREVRFDELRRRGWPLLRRFSGGGTVYHDAGNLNYSFLVNGEQPTKDDVLDVVVRALARLGRSVERSPQGDLHLGGLKVSGTASQVRRDRWMVHGTLLCRADLDGLHGVLGPTGELLDWVGVSSRPQAVTNLDLDVLDVAQALQEEWWKWQGRAGATALPEAAEHEFRLRSRAWTWDRTPPFRWIGPTRLGRVGVRVQEGRVLEATAPPGGDETQNLSRMVGMTFFSSEVFDLFAEESQ